MCHNFSWLCLICHQIVPRDPSSRAARTKADVKAKAFRCQFGQSQRSTAEWRAISWCWSWWYKWNRSNFIAKFIGHPINIYINGHYIYIYINCHLYYLYSFIAIQQPKIPIFVQLRLRQSVTCRLSRAHGVTGLRLHDQRRCHGSRDQHARPETSDGKAAETWNMPMK